MGHAACARMLTPSVPVAIEIVSGSTDGEDHKITAVKVRERASEREKWKEKPCRSAHACAGV